MPSANRPPRPLVMGIVNVTPDSFSDGGRFFAPERAIDHFHRLVEEGADIIDIGGESSRPGAEPVDAGEEWRRLRPVLARISPDSPVPISVDTYKANVARRALDSGARAINDISAMRFDPEMPSVIAESGAAVILMHMQGTPRSMQKNPVYRDVVSEVCEFLQHRAQAAIEAGIARGKIILDPGIGFGKTLEHNLTILRHLPDFVRQGYPILVGASRKSFIKMVSGVEDGERLEGSLAAAVLAAQAGAAVVRVHDVAQTRRALEICAAVANPGMYTEKC
jgi:dihydropteroate synthase